MVLTVLHITHTADHLPCLQVVSFTGLPRPCLCMPGTGSALYCKALASTALHFMTLSLHARTGNHDGEADLSRREVMALDAATGGSLSLSQSGPATLSGAGNYWLDVLEPGNSSQVAARLWFLDSGNRGCNGGAAGW